MFEFEAYIKKLLDERGINEQDKEELYYEIKDHLILLKNEYISKGLSEQEAVKLSIKSFGDSNFIGNNIKKSLPSNNKYRDFSLREKVVCLLEMFLVYVFFICLCAAAWSVVAKSAFFNVGAALVVTLTSFIFINKKISNERNKLKNLLICNISFFVIEKAMLSLFTIVVLNISGGVTDSIALTLKNSYIFNLTYIVAFILLTLASFIVTKYIGELLFKDIINTYNYTLVSYVLFIISALLLLMYYLIPNRFYALRYIIVNSIGEDITSVSKNIFYIVINNGFIIPNVGILLLIMLAINVSLHIKKKGIESIL